jgi:protein-tyrosine-phosphatase
MMRECLDATTARLSAKFAGVFSEETVARVVDQTYEELAQRATVRFQFIATLAERFAREQLLAAAQAEGLIAKELPEVLFVCERNAGRSQMAAAIAHQLAHGRIGVRSAGSQPGEQIHPAVIEAMSELGLDVSREFPKPLTDAVVRAADVVVTMGCGDSCPVYPGKQYQDWPVADPAGQTLEAVRQIRLDIYHRVWELLAGLLPEGTLVELNSAERSD